MQKKFFSNLLLILLLNLLVKPFYIIGVDAEVIERTGANSYGIYFSLMSFSFLFTAFLDAGVNNFNTTNIARYSFLVKKHFSRIFSLKLMLIIGYFIVVLVSGIVVGYSSYQLKLLCWIGFNQALLALVLYFRSNLSGLQLFKQDSIVSVIDKFLLVVFCSVLLWGGFTGITFTIEWFIGLQTIAYFCTAIIALFILVKRAGRLRFSFDFTFSLAIIRKSYPYALLILLMYFYTRTDSVMLERMLPNGAEQSGIYAMGYRFFEAGNNLFYLFAVLLLPIFARMIQQNEKIGTMVALSFQLITFVSITVAVICFFYGEQILDWRYSENVQEASPPFRYLMLSTIGFSTTYIFGTLLTANGSLRQLNFMALVGIATNIILNLILIPKLEAYGAALATFITQLLTALIQVIIAQNIFRFTINYRLIVKILFFIGIMITIGMQSVRYSVLPIFAISGLVLVGLTFFLWTGIPAMKEFKSEL